MTDKPSMKDLPAYDFLDFGCSAGGSMEFALEHLGAGRGLGLDIEPAKVLAARGKGFEAEVADLSSPLDLQPVRFVILSHFLEHLASAAVAEKVINTACQISRGFVFIRHPWFDSDGALAVMGVKMFWSDWTGHSNHMSALQFYSILMKSKGRGIISGFQIFGHEPVTSTAADCIIPIDAKPDQHHYSLSSHGKKEISSLPFPCFRELIIVVGISPEASLEPPPIISRRQLLVKACA